MNTTTTTATSPAQVGAGRTVHQVASEEFATDTLCGRPVSRVLTAEQAAKKGKECKECAKAAAAPAAEDTTEAPAAIEPAEVEETEAPAAAEQAPQVDEDEPAPAEPIQVEKPAQVEDAPQVDEVEPAPAAPVQVRAYTAACEQLHINGQDNPDRVLALDAEAVAETVAAMRRMPRWNAAQDRFTVNKVAVIVAQDATGERVWVRGEAAPFRVSFTGAPVAEDAPAETATVDLAAVLAATRPLRRRAEVQRVIDNRTNAMAMSTPAPAPVEEPAPAPVVEEAPAAEEEVTYGKPEWRTLKGLEAPFQLYGTQSGRWFRPAGDRKQCHGFPLDIVRSWVATGARYAEDAEGNTHSLGGVATRYWIATPTA